MQRLRLIGRKATSIWHVVPIEVAFLFSKLYRWFVA
jgi:hypothetical protein